MDVPILSGGVILLIAVVLWLVYLVPSWQSRHQFNATERNAVRLSQALRILAETSEAPAELQLELDTRTAYEQSRMARRAEADRARAELDRIRDDAEHSRALERIAADNDREVARIQSAHERELARAEAGLEKERARMRAIAEQDVLTRHRAELAQERRESGIAAARARQKLRLIATGVLVTGFVAAGVGVWLLAAFSLAWPLIGGIASMLAAVVVLQRMARVARRTRTQTVQVAAPIAVATRPRLSLPIHDEPAPRWTPRNLPQPLSSVVGSSASQVQDQVDAREALRRAAQEESLRQKVAEQAPVRIESVRPAAAPAAEASAFSGMGIVSDSEIEEHVRLLLARRIAG